jgi:hypothetical protein
VRLEVRVEEGGAASGWVRGDPEALVGMKTATTI